MTKMETDGFLSDEAEQARAIFRKEFSAWFEIAEKLNRRAISTLAQAPLKDIDQAQQVVCLLTIRVLEAYESIVLLMERGLLSSAKFIVRPMLEALFTLAAIDKDSSLAVVYLDGQRAADLNSLKSSCAWKNKDLMNKFKEHKLESKYIKLKGELKNKPVTQLMPVEWAKKSDYEDFYHLYYVEYCSSIHSNPRALNEHMDIDGDDVALAFGPTTEGFGTLLGNASYFFDSRIFALDQLTGHYSRRRVGPSYCRTPTDNLNVGTWPPTPAESCNPISNIKRKYRWRDAVAPCRPNAR